ncbi:hypothetical protein GCM10009611_02050 [Arthrobacter roseus]
MDDSFGDPLMIEMHDLFAQMMILQEGGAAISRFERVVCVIDPDALRGGKEPSALGLRMLWGAGGYTGW